MGELVEYFLIYMPWQTISLREVVKTCNFCNNACVQNIRNQIIEVSIDEDVVKDLLQETDLTSSKVVHKYQAQEAAKKQQATAHSNN